MAIIELVILGISIYEYILLRRNIIGTPFYYKVEPKHMNHGKNVMSGLMDEERRLNNSLMNSSQTIYSGNDPQSKDEKTPLTYEEFISRRKTLESLLNKLKGKATNMN